MKNLFYSFVILSVALLALFTISQLSTAQNKTEAGTESKNQKGLQKTNRIQTRSSDSIWTQIAANGVGQGTLSNSTTATSAAWMTGGPYGGNVRALAIDPTTPAMLYAGTDSGVFKSIDSGGTWFAANTGPTNPGGGLRHSLSN
ncbi:MAG: hypothetical protein WBD27_19735 [Pyrinomonadaceae bacterium]